MRKLEWFVFKILLPLVVVNFIVCDFLHEYEWVTFGLQFGPIAAVVAFIIVVGLLVKRPYDEEKVEETDTKGGRKWIIFLVVLVISLNLLWGEPASNLLNIKRFEFWAIMIIIPLLRAFDYKKKTDNTREEKRYF
ncbi:hypothetical protein [Jeotgalicoccus sp. ATCC 8456]|uniref:hypothetical protein n=1 Tax=Jeotgalicoccus sp. ATCC 8456 TaxID=946435 RepID=UPI0018E5E14E|nr:hypothetical protein [Jeotgalicoccus sp. ATCC 8456]QQD84582.1 hypothetical protein JEM45_08100 [Jeotgalicoccus sp. ATCC 8456]